MCWRTSRKGIVSKSASTSDASRASIGIRLILLADLHGMASIEEERDVGLSQPAREFANAALHAALVEIETDGDIEPKAPQSGGQILGIIAWIRQDTRVLIVRVADDECNTSFCCGWPWPKSKKRNYSGSEKNS